MEKPDNTQDLRRGAGVGPLAHNEIAADPFGIARADAVGASRQRPRPDHNSIAEGARGRCGAIGCAGQVAL